MSLSERIGAVHKALADLRYTLPMDISDGVPNSLVDLMEAFLNDLSVHLKSRGFALEKGPNKAEATMIIDGNCIGAIKSIRNRYGISLKEAKDIYDGWKAEHGTIWASDGYPIGVKWTWDGNTDTLPKI